MIFNRKIEIKIIKLWTQIFKLITFLHTIQIST